MTLFLLQGNDYLPRVRGITSSKTLMTYSKLCQKFPGRFITDLDNNTFDLKHLFMFFRELSKQEAKTPLLTTFIPTATEALRNMLQKRNVETGNSTAATGELS